MNIADTANSQSVQHDRTGQLLAAMFEQRQRQPVLQAGLPALLKPDAERSQALTAERGDALLSTLAEQAQQLEALFQAFAARAVAAKGTREAEASLGAAVRAQQAGLRTLVAVAGLLAQRRGAARVVLSDDNDAA